MKARNILLAALFVVCCGCEVGYDWHVVVKEPPPAVSAQVFTDPEPLDEGDDRLFRRLRGHIDRRVEERLVGAMQEASGETKSGLGSILAGAVAKLVKVILLSIIEAILVAVLVALIWKYLWWLLAILLAWLGFSALAGYLGGRHATKRGGGRGSQPGPQQPASATGP